MLPYLKTNFIRGLLHLHLFVCKKINNFLNGKQNCCYNKEFKLIIKRLKNKELDVALLS